MNLSQLSADPPKNAKRKQTKEAVKDLAKQIAELHEIFFAQKKHNLLVIFQGMDSSGKDGSTKNVFKYCSPIAMKVKSFKKPTEEEFAHDFLWRVHKEVPQKGQITIFNRSHYEDILIQRVHGWISEEHVAKRMAAINAFEELLQFDNNTTILKFYLHLTPDRQKEKLQERIDVQEKNWKHNSGDWKERQHWDKYMSAYEDVLTKCNAIPWHIIPANSRWYRNYCVAKIVLKTMQDMNLQYPVVDPEDLKV